MLLFTPQPPSGRHAGSSSHPDEGRVDIRLASVPWNHKPETSDIVRGIKSSLTLWCLPVKHIFIFSLLPLICSPPQTLEVIWKLETCEHPPSVVTYGWSDCGNYLCHLLWTYWIWVSGPQWKQLKEGDLGDGGGSRWQSGGEINRARCIFSPPTSACKQMWFSSVIWYISVMWIPFDK